jgi:hypothetical protein
MRADADRLHDKVFPCRRAMPLPAANSSKAQRVQAVFGGRPALIAGASAYLGYAHHQELLRA